MDFGHNEKFAIVTIIASRRDPGKNSSTSETVTCGGSSIERRIIIIFIVYCPNTRAISCSTKHEVLKHGVKIVRTILKFVQICFPKVFRSFSVFPQIVRALIEKFPRHYSSRISPKILLQVSIDLRIFAENFNTFSMKVRDTVKRNDIMF